MGVALVTMICSQSQLYWGQHGFTAWTGQQFIKWTHLRWTVLTLLTKSELPIFKAVETSELSTLVTLCRVRAQKPLLWRTCPPLQHNAREMPTEAPRERTQT